MTSPDEPNAIGIDLESLSDEEFGDLAERIGNDLRKEFRRRETMVRGKLDASPYLRALSPCDAVEARTVINAISSYVILHASGDVLDPGRYAPIDPKAVPASDLLAEFLILLSPRSTPEAKTISDSLGAYANICADRKAAGEPFDQEGWRTAGVMFQRGMKALAQITGMQIIETSSPARAASIMKGFDPGEPPPPTKPQA